MYDVDAAKQASRMPTHPQATVNRPQSSAVAATWDAPLPMNVAMPIAAVLLDLGFAADVVKAVPVLARTAGLLAHLAEERERPFGFLLAARAKEAVEYERGADA